MTSIHGKIEAERDFQFQYPQEKISSKQKN